MDSQAEGGERPPAHAERRARSLLPLLLPLLVLIVLAFPCLSLLFFSPSLILFFITQLLVCKTSAKTACKGLRRGRS